MRAGYADHFRADESRLVRTQYHITLNMEHFNANSHRICYHHARTKLLGT